MTSLFISDLHLDQSRPHIVELFEHFLAGQARQAEALYILGDLFEAWLGDDDDSALASRSARALHALAGHGVAVYFIAGNRDFLLGADYAARSGMHLLDDRSTINLYGQPTLLLHGDTLCSDDIEYQKFRAQVREPAWQEQFLKQPLAARRAYAAQARDASRAHTGSSDRASMDVNPGAVRDTLRQAGVLHMIHGHTHRPAVHALNLDGQDGQRIVLGDWYQQGSVLRVSAQSSQLQALSTNAPRPSGPR